MKKPVSEFRSEVRAHVSHLLTASPLGFSFQDIAAKVGSGDGLEELGLRRLRHQVGRLEGQKLLTRSGNGRYVAGPAAHRLDEPDLHGALYGAFVRLGGLATIGELLKELEPLASTERQVRAAMSAGDRYFRGIPVEGFRNHWVLNDVERGQVPLAGNRQLFELRAIRLRRGITGNAGLAKALTGLRRRIGTNLAAARDLMGRPVEAMGQDKALMGAMDLRLGGISHAFVGRGKGAQSVRDWWNELKQGRRAEEAFGLMWQRVEGTETVFPVLLGYLDVECWETIGVSLGLDPAALSRGALLATLPTGRRYEK